MANVIFKVGTSAQYLALATKDANTLYWLTDTQELYKGDVLYGVGHEATATSAGLLSAVDKAKLDAMTGGAAFNLTPVDASVVVADGATGKTVGVQISQDSNNALELKGDGLYVPEYVPIKGGETKTVTVADQPYAGAVVGDSYIDIVLSDAAATHVYIPAKGLVDEYKAGDGIEINNYTVAMKLDSSTTNGLTATTNGLGLGLASATDAGAMSATDKAFLDSLHAFKDQAEESFTWADM